MEPVRRPDRMGGGSEVPPQRRRESERFPARFTDGRRLGRLGGRPPVWLGREAIGGGDRRVGRGRGGFGVGSANEGWKAWARKAGWIRMSGDSVNEDGPETSMDREALLDIASLEVLGLLDEASAEAFRVALDAAPERWRAEVIERQAEWASDPRFLASSHPSPELRARTLAAVTRAMRVGAAIPVAAGVAAFGDRSSRSDGRLVANEESVSAPLRQIVEQLRLRQEADRQGRAAPWLWRAASLVLGAGLLVSAWFQIRMSDRVAEIAELSMQRQTDEQLRALIGEGFERFLVPRSSVIGLAAAAPDGRGGATVYRHPDGDGFLLVLGLPSAAGPYELRAVCCDDEATTESVLTFEPMEAASGFRLSADRLASLGAGARWEIVDGSGAVVLRSA